MNVYLIEKIWINESVQPQHDGIRYTPVGYISGEEQAREFCAGSKLYCKGYPQFRCQPLNAIILDDESMRRAYYHNAQPELIKSLAPPQPTP